MSTELDWNILTQTFYPERRYAFEEVKDQFKKVAYDVYKPLDGSEKLWELREDEDGQKYLYALYEDSDDLVSESDEDNTTIQRKAWEAISDVKGENITLSYKGVPLYRFASKECGFAPDQAEEFSKFIESKASDEKFVEMLLENMPPAKREAVAGLITGDN